MFAVDLLFAFLVALLLSFALVPWIVGRRGQDGPIGAAVVFFFMILFFATWAGGVWLAPLGTTVWGVHWLPFVMVGVFLALMLAVATEPARRDRLLRRTASVEAVDAETVVLFGALFWIFLIGVAAVAVLRYVWV